MEKIIIKKIETEQDPQRPIAQELFSGTRRQDFELSLFPLPAASLSVRQIRKKDDDEQTDEGGHVQQRKPRGASPIAAAAAAVRW